MTHKKHHEQHVPLFSAAQRLEEIWVWLWYVRCWQAERDAALKAFTYALGLRA